MEKIFRTIVAEVVEAIIFVMLIIFVASVAEDFPTVEFLIPMLVSVWGIVGIATPFVIAFELEEVILDALKNLRFK